MRKNAVFDAFVDKSGKKKARFDKNGLFMIKNYVFPAFTGEMWGQWSPFLCYF